MKKLILSTCLIVFCLFATAQSKTQSYLDYIAQYRELALEHQKKYGIPASITLAQGILESAAGKSDLAVNAKNHFGIKCTSDWEGKTYNYGRKSTGDCYRKYNKVADSYEDHAQFLLRKRYASLFELSIKNYKDWAYGLKACGYASDPKYPEKLIRINELYELDKLASKKTSVKSNTSSKKNVKSDRSSKKKLSTEKEDDIKKAALAVENADIFSMPPMEDIKLFYNHQSGRRNGVRYVIAGPNETFASLALSLNMYERTLRRYNDAPDNYEISEGEIVYIYPKKKKASRKYPFCHPRENDTARDIAQRYAIRLKSFYKLNGIPYGDPIRTHQQFNLR